MAVERHSVNLSRRVWGELKIRAFQENLSASEMIVYLVEQGARAENARAALPRYQQRDPEETRLGRTVFFPSETWRQARALAEQQGTSVSAFIDDLLKVYLGLLEEDQPPESPRGKVVRVGNEQVYLGENPVEIDLKKGRTKEE